jgi:hypothetical protein
MSLAEQLFKKNGTIKLGHVYLDANAGGDEAWATTQEVVAPTAYDEGYQLWITRITVCPSVVGVGCSVAIASFAESDTASPTTIFEALFHNSELGPVVLDLRDGPIPVTANQRILAKIASASTSPPHYAAVDITCVETKTPTYPDRWD